ncbi:hypothetical protein AMEC673_10170 [Alteromonas macleodii str. 'English Channel 673']|uniref:DUF3987 domain-containing protein n=1 Tax=Alteromonas macleodii (strain English Channel 673) TaxID=1004788 RepID=A0AB32ZYM5_ALTME|nr:YfjI family protein [Alteromonas macleodii]AFT74728.1 hypothetical protein AMEC673_10170 [Alteromonas macleodii str. 'English Channel 673']
MRPSDFAKADRSDHIELYSCDKVSKLIEELHEKTQAPISLILICVISTYSTLCQPLIDVEIIQGERASVSSYSLIIAASGEGKSTVLKYLQKPIEEHQSFLTSKYDERCLEFCADQEINKIKEKSLKKQIKMCLAAQKDYELRQLKKELVLLKRDSEEPILKKILVEDITPEALAYDLANGSGALTLSSSEGNTILNGRISSDLSFLNKAWAGEQYSVDRRGAKSFTLSNYRLTVLISTQPSTVTQFLTKKGELAIDSGLMARFLICEPVSTQGSRKRHSNKIEEQDAYKNYLNQARELLHKEHLLSSTGQNERYLVKFTPEARVDWLKLCVEVEEELKAGGAFEYARGHGSKIPEQIARVAAILTYIEYGESKDISREILYDAVTIVRYSSNAYLRLFQAYPDYIKDAQLLDTYFQTLKEAGERYIKKNGVLQSGPSRLRDKSRLNRALSVLQEKYQVNILHAQNGLVVLDLLPHLAPCDMAWNCFVRKYGISIASPPGV